MESLLPVMCQDHHQEKPIPGPWAPDVSSSWPLDKSLGPHAGLDSPPDSASFGTTRPAGHLRLVQTPAIGEPRLVLWSSRAGDTHRVFDSLQDLCLTIAVAHFTEGGDELPIEQQRPS